MDKSGKMTTGPIKTLGFQDQLSGIALSFDFEEEKREKNKRYEEHQPERRKLQASHQQ